MAWSDAARRAAAEVRRLRARDARLFHGTTSNVKRVTPQPGVGRGRGTYLSTDPKDARLFAQEAARNRGGKPVVFMVRARQQKRLRMAAILSSYDKHSWLTTSTALTAARRLTLGR